MSALATEGPCPVPANSFNEWSNADAEPQPDLGPLVARAHELSLHFHALKSRLIVLMDPAPTGRVAIPEWVTHRYENTSRASGFELPRGTVISSGLPEFKTGSRVAVRDSDGFVFTGGQWDPDSPTVSELLRPAEEVRFYRPERHWQTYQKGRKTECQFDIGASVIGI